MPAPDDGTWPAPAPVSVLYCDMLREEVEPDCPPRTCDGWFKYCTGTFTGGLVGNPDEVGDGR